MASTTELLDNGAQRGDSKDNSVDVRTFYVVLDSATDDPVEFAGVDLDSAHPRISGLKCDARRVRTKIDSLRFIVDCYYSDNNQFTFPTFENPDNFNAWALHYMRDSVDCPILYRMTYCGPSAGCGTGGGGVRTFKKWVRSTVKKTHFNVTAERTCRVPFINATLRAFIAGQVGKYHDLSGNTNQDPLSATLYQFIGCDITQVGSAEWRLVYSWFRSPGVSPPPMPNPLPSGMTAADIVVPSAPRPPFGDWQVFIAPLACSDSPPADPGAAQILSIPTFSPADITTSQALSLPGNPLA